MAVDDNTFHQHALTVLAADVTAAVEKTYTVSSTGQPAHTHEVTLTPAHFAMLSSTGSVTVEMNPDTSGHTHNYTVTCA